MTEREICVVVYVSLVGARVSSRNRAMLSDLLTTLPPSSPSAASQALVLWRRHGILDDDAAVPRTPRPPQKARRRGFAVLSSIAAVATAAARAATAAAARAATARAPGRRRRPRTRRRPRRVAHCAAARGQRRRRARRLRPQDADAERDDALLSGVPRAHGARYRCGACRGADSRVRLRRPQPAGARRPDPGVVGRDNRRRGSNCVRRGYGRGQGGR